MPSASATVLGKTHCIAAAETPVHGDVTAEQIAGAWGELRCSREGIHEEEDEVVLQVLHQVLAPIRTLKAADEQGDAHDLALILAPAVFQLDTKGSVVHSLQLAHAEAALYVLAELV